MKIVIAGGTHEAEYIVHEFNRRGNKLIVINPSKTEAQILSERENISVYVSDPWKIYVFEDCKVANADIFIALCEHDTDNYAACMMAKNLFGVKKCICVVTNPNNVELYTELGIDSVISSTYLLADAVRSESSVEELIRAVSFEKGSVRMIDATISADLEICGKKIMDAHFPAYASIACIVRNRKDLIIPKGAVELRAKDKLMMICAPADQAKLIKFIKTPRKSEAPIEEQPIPEVPEEKSPEVVAPAKPKAKASAKKKPAEKKPEEKPAPEEKEEPKPEEKPAEKKPASKSSKAKSAKSKEAKSE